MQTAKKNIIGIMGGIASGKSTVANELAKLGCAVIDADKMAKELLGNEDVKKSLKNRFGSGILDKNNKIDKKKLADLVFSNSEAVKAINDVIHPGVLRETEKLIEQYNSRMDIKAIVLDMPLLAEVGWEKKCDKLVFVRCDEEKRLERAQKKALLDKSELKKRENFQISLDKKIALAQYIVDNNDLSEMIRQIGKLFPALIS